MKNLAATEKEIEIPFGFAQGMLRRCACMGDDDQNGLGGGGHLLFLSYPLTDPSTHGAVFADAVLPNPAH